MLGLVSFPKDDSGFSPAEAVYGSTLSLSGELSPESFLRQVEQAVLGFSGPPWHHVVPQPQPHPLPRALLDAEFVFVRDDASKPSLSPLYRGPYQVDSVSMERLKPVISSVHGVPAVPPLWGWPCLVPASVSRPPVPCHPPVKKVSFTPVPATQLCRNPHQTVWGSPPLSAVLCPHLLGGVSVATTKMTFGTSFPQPG